MSAPAVIVIGGLNTDIIGLGVDHLLGPGELTLSGELKIAAGGKSRNIAQMISLLLGSGKVAMLGRTCRDPQSFWEVPYQALIDSGVNVEHVNILNYEDEKKYPGIALIPVNIDGENQIYVLPGVNNDFCPADIDAAEEVFSEAEKQNGVLAFSLELPLATATHAVKMAKKYSLSVILDPGGLPELDDPKLREEYMNFFASGIDIIKPNEHEAKILTGVEVTDLDSAKKAADILRSIGIPQALITAGCDGAYLCTESDEASIPIPKIDVQSDVRDATGCGDQVMATLCSLVTQGKTLQEAVPTAILAGTLQFYRAGVNPLTMEEILKYT